MTSFRQLSNEGFVGVELKVERCGEGFGGVEARRKISELEEGGGVVFICERN